MVGLLWSVTDKDIDLFTQRLLQLWLLDPNARPQLTDCVRSAGDACKLKQLTAGAAVVYGLPVARRELVLDSTTRTVLLRP